VVEQRWSRAEGRVQMRILLLGETGHEPGYEAWRLSLARAGVPFDAIALAQRDSPLRIISPTGTVCYQALILAKDGLIDLALDEEELGTLDRVQRELGVRELTAYAYPGPRCGLGSPTWAGRLDGQTGSLTARGHEVFPYLMGSVPIDVGTWGYLATPDPSQRFETLLVGPDGSSLLGVHHDEGRERMVQTFDSNSGQLHTQLLRHGLLSWLTRGTFLGYERNYLTLQVDDVLLPNHSWDPERHMTATDDDRVLRMSTADATRTARWSRSRGIRLDLACNGAGSRRYVQEHGTDEDPLLAALLADQDAFGWINHTFEHQNLDQATRAAIEQEIEQNLAWALQHGIEFEPHVLITGEHTGLANLAATPPRGENPNLAPALAAAKINFLACDASRPYPAGPAADAVSVPAGEPFFTGSALAIPRYPTALAHDVATPEQLLDRLRWAGQSAAQSWPEVVSVEARRMLTKLLGNDPRPHFFHQSNLIEHRADHPASRSSLLCELVDALLDLYHSLIRPSTPIVQPTLAEIGRRLLRLEAWRHAATSGRVRAYLEGDGITISNRAGTALEFPLTGTLAGEDYGVSRSGWVSVPPGTSVFERAPA
jgi:hypothetical protein